MTCCLQQHMSDTKLIAELTRELFDTRRRLTDLEDKDRRRESWMAKAKQDAGASHNTSFDDVWAEALQALREKRDAEQQN